MARQIVTQAFELEWDSLSWEVRVILPGGATWRASWSKRLMERRPTHAQILHAWEEDTASGRRADRRYWERY